MVLMKNEISPKRNKTLYNKDVQIKYFEIVYDEYITSIYESLKTYSNVHRGSGHFSVVTTKLYEKCRKIVLNYLDLNKNEYTVIFCSPLRAGKILAQLKNKEYHVISSEGVGLPLGIRILVIKKKALKRNIDTDTGGGTARLVGKDWVIWSKLPDKIEAGTPAIINIIAFARALQLMKKYNLENFKIIQEISNNFPHTKTDLSKLSGLSLLKELRKTLIGNDIRVPVEHGEKSFINLDNGASTSTFEPIWETVKAAWKTNGAQQVDIIDQTKKKCSDFINAPVNQYQIIFTSNTTEAINLGAKNFAKKEFENIDPVILNTDLEHNSNEIPWRQIKGASLIRIGVDKEGMINIDELERLLSNYNVKNAHGKKRIKLFAISGASNVLGSYNNLRQIGQITHKYGAELLVDAAQMIAHRPIDMLNWHIDYLAFSGHKMYAPFGSGALVIRKNLINFSDDRLQAILKSGEENIGGIAAMAKSFDLLNKIGLDTIQKEEEILTLEIIKGIESIAGVKIYGNNDTHSSIGSTYKGGIVIFNTNKLLSFKVGDRLAFEGGIGVRCGCHCSHIIVKKTLNVSAGLEKFQKFIIRAFPKLELPGVVRISLGLQNSLDDIKQFLNALRNITISSKKNNVKKVMDSYAGSRIEQVFA